MKLAISQQKVRVEGSGSGARRRPRGKSHPESPSPSTSPLSAAADASGPAFALDGSSGESPGQPQPLHPGAPPPPPAPPPAPAMKGGSSSGGLQGGRRGQLARGGGGGAPSRLRLPLLISVDRDVCLVCAIGLTLVVSLLLYSGLLHVGGGGLLEGGRGFARGGSGAPLAPVPRAPRPPTLSHMRSTFRRLVQPAPDTRVDLPATPPNKHVLAFYFPQFHEFEVNNVLWGKGYTDFRGVEAATTARHGYPVIRPLDGSYNLLDYWTRHRQARVARQYGIHGFVYYHYWFSGGPVMEAPLLALLEDDEPNIPFALAWANEHWTRRWDGGNNEVLMEQRYEPSDSRPHWEWLLRFFHHKNYILRDNKPMLLIYRSADVPALAYVVQQWTEWAIEAGFAGLYVTQMNGVLWSQTAWNLQPGVQGIAEFYPNLYASTQLRPSHALWANYHARFGVDNPRDYFYGVHASFNNKPRHLADGRETVLPYHPVNLRHALRQQLGRTANDSFVFLNAWNEWGEGEAVEPSQEFGHSWLQAIKDAIADDATGIEGPLVPLAGIPWLGDGRRSGGSLGGGGSSSGAGSSSGGAEVASLHKSLAGRQEEQQAPGAARAAAAAAAAASPPPSPPSPAVCLVILTDGSQMDGSPSLFTLRHHLDTLERLERRDWVGFVVDVGIDSTAFVRQHLEGVVAEAEDDRLTIVTVPDALRGAPASSPSARYRIADAVVAEHCLGIGRSSSSSSAGGEDGEGRASGGRRLRGTGSEAGGGAEAEQQQSGEGGALGSAPAAAAAAAAVEDGAPFAKPIAPWFLITSASNFYAPDALNYLPEDADLVVMNYHSATGLVSSAGASKAASGGARGPSNCCTRLNTYQCPTASPRIGNIDLGAMLFSSHSYAAAELALGDFLDACSYPEAPCPDGALAEYVDGRLSWRTRFHPPGACALYHNPNPLSCALVGGLFYDTDDVSKARCFEPPDFPIALGSVDWSKFADKAGCVCEN